MKWIDLLRMSSVSLKRRKLRTFLTILGVVIGTASIVVMISLGLGMQRATYQQVAENGSLTSIEVTGSTDEYSRLSEKNSHEKKYITDDTIKMLNNLEHVELASPVFRIDGTMLKGKYEGNVSIVGMTPEALKRENIELEAGGKLPEENSTNLEAVYGNTVITDFTEKGSGRGYWENGEYAQIDFMKDTLFLILDQKNYEGSQSRGELLEKKEEEANAAAKPAKKYIVEGCAVAAGGPDVYSSYSSNVYCDLKTLINILKKEFRGRAIPGQPATKTGKPYSFFTYSSAKVHVDDLKNVETVSKTIRDLGYQVESNVDFMNSMKKQFVIVQAVLGGIGAVSLLVAAIGITNTMMMSIYERTKEIGVIKVLGCSLKNIKRMFLLEAAFIGFFGGFLGNILSFVISFGINRIAGLASIFSEGAAISYIPVWLVVVSIGFAILVGMAAGFFPALRAMRLSPLEAIRNS